MRSSGDNGVSLAGRSAEGEAGGGAGLDGIGLLAAEEGGAVVLVALRIAAGEGEGATAGGVGGVGGGVAELVEEVQQVVGVLAGGVEADDEVDGAVRAGRCVRGVGGAGRSRRRTRRRAVRRRRAGGRRARKAA